MTRFLSLLAVLVMTGSFIACKPKQAAEPAAPAPAAVEAPEAAPAVPAEVPAEAPPAQ